MIKKDSRSRSRRLRKKLHVGEFEVKGFTIKLTFKESQDESHFQAFMQDFFHQAIEQKGLLFSGWGTAESFQGLVMTDQRYSSVEETQRQQVMAWLNAHPLIASATASELLDAYYGATL
ncbi:MAG: DUF469 family protein [Oceanospirillaceae bacterium]|nr:DUF469 family protein [Oceanospirillaceae bacterium]